MKHSFTDQQLTDAYKAALKECGCGDTAADYMNAFLNALPEPATDEWQECGFNDFRPTDKRVKAVFIGGSIIEGTPDRRNHEHVFLVDGPVIHSCDDATFYRIPKPVQHPDPAEHKYILVHEFRSDHSPWVMPVLGEANDEQTGYYINGLFRHATEIMDWQHLTPAKVVADDD